MLHTCIQTFDVTNTVENILKTKQGLNPKSHQNSSRLLEDENADVHWDLNIEALTPNNSASKMSDVAQEDELRTRGDARRANVVAVSMHGGWAPLRLGPPAVAPPA